MYTIHIYNLEDDEIGHSIGQEDTMTAAKALLHILRPKTEFEIIEDTDDWYIVSFGPSKNPRYSKAYIIDSRGPYIINSRSS